MRKLIYGVFGTLCIIVTIIILVGMFSNPDMKRSEDMTIAEQFAQDNGISVALAENIEDVLSQSEMPSSLESLKDWEQIEDYAYGQRYTAWSYSNVNERYYYMVFYVNDDVVESVRDQKNGLDVLYSKE